MDERKVEQLVSLIQDGMGIPPTPKPRATMKRVQELEARVRELEEALVTANLAAAAANAEAEGVGAVRSNVIQFPAPKGQPRVFDVLEDLVARLEIDFLEGRAERRGLDEDERARLQHAYRTTTYRRTVR